MPNAFGSNANGRRYVVRWNEGPPCTVKRSRCLVVIAQSRPRMYPKLIAPVLKRWLANRSVAMKFFPA